MFETDAGPRGQEHGAAFYSDDYIDDYDNLNNDGTGVPTAAEPLDSFQITAYDPSFQTPSWMANANVYQIFPDRFRNGDPINDYCVAGSTSGCPSLYGAPATTTVAVTPWNTKLCNPRQGSELILAEVRRHNTQRISTVMLSCNRYAVTALSRHRTKSVCENRGKQQVLP